MKSLLSGLIIGLTFSAQAGISSNFGVTSDYVWRGKTQTAHASAVQGGMDYDHASGLSAGIWASNVADNNAEVDFYSSYSYEFNKNISASVGATLYHYTKVGAFDTTEYNLGLSLWMLDLLLITQAITLVLV